MVGGADALTRFEGSSDDLTVVQGIGSRFSGVLQDAGITTFVGIDGPPKKRVTGGTKVAINAKDGVKINDANVIKTDIGASNGVVHVIDTVLIPENL